ncbi:hypothetical protein GCM10027589_15550 [Actinocorallia lasiicapitis]
MTVTMLDATWDGPGGRPVTGRQALDLLVRAHPGALHIWVDEQASAFVAVVGGVAGIFVAATPGQLNGLLAAATPPVLRTGRTRSRARRSSVRRALAAAGRRIEVGSERGERSRWG